MERDGDNEEDDEDGEDAEEHDDEEEKEEDQGEDDGKQPRMSGQGEMVNPSDDDVDTMVDVEPIVLRKQGPEMAEHTPRAQLAPRAPRPHTAEPRTRPQTPETHLHSGAEVLVLMMAKKPHPVVPTLRRAEEAWNTCDVDVDQQLLGESAAGDSRPNSPRPNFPLRDVPLFEVRPDIWVGKGWTSPHIAENVTVLTFGLEGGSCLICFLCSNIFISGI